MEFINFFETYLLRKTEIEGIHEIFFSAFGFNIYARIVELEILTVKYEIISNTV
jgi:hypothetical protein